MFGDALERVTPGHCGGGSVYRSRSGLSTPRVLGTHVNKCASGIVRWEV